MMHELMDMDTQQKIRYLSESSNTSGYSTISTGSVLQRNGNTSPSSSVFSMSPSPAHSPATTLQAEFSNLNLPSTSPQAHYTPLSQQQQQQHQQTMYGNFLNFDNNTATQGGNNVNMQQQQQQHQFVQQPLQQFGMILANNMLSSSSSSHTQGMDSKNKYTAELVILEQPVEKFRFRYKSEMHGTHGSLNGANSKRTPKTYPEVELRNFNGRAIIRCSLFQTGIESPHSHQLVVRKDETDICDPHNLEVSPEIGFVAQFQNMGIIHTAKKFIFDELIKKKKDRLCFEIGREELSTKELQELHKQTEKEAKDMNLNQVRLCFEAFKIEDDNRWSRIAAPVYTNFINNRKSAQTGELRIVRLSIATGSVVGGEDLILLVEKVSKKNIKVRFFEEDDDGEVQWEAWGRFRESDVHHQYAIVCQTPAYRDKDIDKPVEVNIELVRPSDDERSYPPVTFRYKPRDAIASRKRRRTCSTVTSSSGSGSSLNSFELPKTVQEQQIMNTATNQQNFNIPATAAFGGGGMVGQTISQEYNKEKLLQSEDFKNMVDLNSEELMKICPNLMDLIQDGKIEYDGESSTSTSKSSNLSFELKNSMLDKVLSNIKLNPSSIVAGKNDYLQKIFKIYDEAMHGVKQLTNTQFLSDAKKIDELFCEYAEKNQHGDSIIHEIIMNDNAKIGMKMCHILKKYELNELLNRVLNANNESGLHYACLNDRPMYIRPLLGLGCDPTIPDRKGNTALHIAVREQYDRCVESFLNVDGLRLNLTLRNDEGETPLHLAVRLKNYDIVKKLLQHDPAAAFIPKSQDGNNILHMAIKYQNPQLVKIILETTTDRNAILASCNTAGLTPLDLAKFLTPKLDDEILSMLMIFKTDPNNLDSLENLKHIIKEELTSSSSNEDDDVDPTIDEDPYVEIKEEIIDENEKIMSNTETIKNIAENLREIIGDIRVFQKLVRILNEQEKWREVARKANLNYLLCILNTAEQLLSHVRNHPLRINYENFVKSVSEVSQDAFEVLRTA